jgi:hypothetical protein
MSNRLQGKVTPVTAAGQGTARGRRSRVPKTKLPDDDLDELAAISPFSVGFHAPRARAAR